MFHFKIAFIVCLAAFYLNCKLDASPLRSFDMNGLINKMYGPVDTNTTEIPELDWDTIKFREITPELKEV